MIGTAGLETPEKDSFLPRVNCDRSPKALASSHPREGLPLPLFEPTKYLRWRLRNSPAEAGNLIPRLRSNDRVYGTRSSVMDADHRADIQEVPEPLGVTILEPNTAVGGKATEL